MGFLGGGAIFNSGTLTLIDCILTRNIGSRGGGLFNNSGTVTITRTTFDGNLALVGGGLSNGGRFPDVEGGTVTIANSTFVHNSALGGGGLFNSNTGTMTLTNTTVAQNVADIEPGGGIDNSNGIVLLQNSVIARNDAVPPFGSNVFASDCFGPLASLGNNLIGDPTAGCDITLQPTDLTGDPGLGTFTDNGTPGNGHFPLLATSQAIDAGNNAVCFRRDQLGRRRIGPCDIGAITFQDKDDHQHEEDLVLLFSEEAFSSSNGVTKASCNRSTAEIGGLDVTTLCRNFRHRLKSPQTSTAPSLPILSSQPVNFIAYLQIFCLVKFTR